MPAIFQNNETSSLTPIHVLKIAYYINKLHTTLNFPGLKCKACSFEALSNEWRWKKSTDALNNNLRPKSDHHGSTQNRKVPVTAICSLSEPETSPQDQGKSHILRLSICIILPFSCACNNAKKYFCL